MFYVNQVEFLNLDVSSYLIWVIPEIVLLGYKVLEIPYEI